MSKYRKGKQPADEYHDDAERIALGTQQPGQTREQTRMIAKGIRKGIEQYKKQHKAKLRELDRNRKKANREQSSDAMESMENEMGQARKPGLLKIWLPWSLLLITWIGIAIYRVVGN